MKTIADIVISVAKLICQRGINWYFTPERAHKHRASDERRFFKYAIKAKRSPGQGDDKIAEYLRIRLNFGKEQTPK